jgi:hypothetical protein
VRSSLLLRCRREVFRLGCREVSYEVARGHGALSELIPREVPREAVDMDRCASCPEDVEAARGVLL